MITGAIIERTVCVYLNLSCRWSSSGSAAFLFFFPFSFFTSSLFPNRWVPFLSFSLFSYFEGVDRGGAFLWANSPVTWPCGCVFLLVSLMGFPLWFHLSSCIFNKSMDFDESNFTWWIRIYFEAIFLLFATDLRWLLTIVSFFMSQYWVLSW